MKRTPSSKRTKALAIKPKTKAAVEKRDGGSCIFCGMPGRGEAHFIARSQGGLGVEENLLTVCRPCHDKLDNSTNRKNMIAKAEKYLKSRYPYWDRSLLIYKKGLNTTVEDVLKKKRADFLRELEEKKRTKAENTTVDGFWFIDEKGDRVDEKNK